MKGDSQLIIKQVCGECSCNEPRLAAYLLHVRKLEKDFMTLELQHVPRADNSAADDLSVKASTWAPMPEGVFERRLLRPTAQPAELGEGGETSTSKLAVLVASQNPPKAVCATGGPCNPRGNLKPALKRLLKTTTSFFSRLRDSFFSTKTNQFLFCFTEIPTSPS